MLHTVTIKAGQSVSTPYALGQFSLCGILVPLITNATLSLLYSLDGQLYVPGHSATGATQLNGATTGNLYWSLNPSDTVGVAYIKINSSAVQSADRVFQLTVRESR